MISNAKHPIQYHRQKKCSKYMRLLATTVATAATSCFLGMQFAFSYKSFATTESFLSSMTSMEKAGDATFAKEQCQVKAYHQLCFNFDGIGSSKCHANPKEFLENKFIEYKPTSKELKARALMAEKKITNLSVGSAKSNICNDVTTQGTLCTDKAELDLFKLDSWLNLLQSTISSPSNHERHDGGFDVIFSEHVLEHFDPIQAQYIAAAAFAVLKPGGVFRIAVPDGYKPSPSYQQYIRPGGTPSGAGQNHMVAWTVDSLPAIFRATGFDIIPREHFDMYGIFHSSADAYDKDNEYGKVMRSLKHDGRNVKPYKNVSNSIGKLHAGDLKADEPMYTSLWFDSVKPVSCDIILTKP